VSVNCNVCGLDFDGPHVMDTSGEAMHPLRVDCINALRARLAQAEAEAARVRAMLDEDEALRDAVRENLPECTCDSDGNLGGEVDRVEFAGEELRRAQAKLAECVDKAAAIIGTGPEMAEGPNHGVVLAALDWLVTTKAQASERRSVVSATFRKRAENVLAATFRGLHHVPHLHRAKWGESNLRVTLHGTLATFDFDELTRLVVAAHDQCIRAELVPLGRHLGLWLHDRKREGEVWDRHPELEEHVAWLRSHADMHWRRVHEEAKEGDRS